VKNPSVLFVAKKELLSLSSAFWVCVFGTFYVALTVALLNYRLFGSALPFETKVSLFGTLFFGIFSAFSFQDTLLLFMNALLVGTNLLLIAKTFSFLKKQRSIRFTVGGASLIALVSTGCTSCGLSILSIVGLGGAFSFLPFHGMELHVLSLGLLTLSGGYLLQQLRLSRYCRR